MKNLRLVALCSLSVVVAGSGVLVACSDDTNVNPTNDGGGPDTGADTSSNPDTGVDGGGDADATDIDAGLTIETFKQAFAAKQCQSLARCCYGNANIDGGATVDGGTYNQAACIANYLANGWETSNTGLAVAADAGTVTLNQATALDCLNKVTAMSCDLPASEFDAIGASCFGAIKGKLADGAGCRVSIECGASSFCKAPAPSTDGGIVGTCAPIRAAGASCGDFTTGDFSTASQVADEACSFRASGIPGLHCDTIADFTTLTPKDQVDWTCTANVPVGGNCATSAWCASGICDPDPASPTSLTCLSPYKLLQFSCGDYVTP